MRKILIAGTFVAMSALFFTACNNPAPVESKETKVSADTSATNAASYECPMKCEGSQSNKPGKCPVCEMELEKKAS